MNIAQGLDEHMMPITAENGVCLALNERIGIETALDELKMQIQSDEVLFWGKVLGVEKDYYIALALYYKNKEFPLKRFYFALSDTFVFSELPQIHKHHLRHFKKYNTYFIGNPDTILEKYVSHHQQQQHQQPLTSYEIEKAIASGKFIPQNELKPLTECDRLSYVVRCIDNDTSVIPVGAMKMIPSNELRRDDNFSGLNADDVGDVRKYCHFRKAQKANKVELIEMGDAVFNSNFLDGLNEDKVQHCWSVHVDNAKTVCNIRSLVWPGYFAYHKTNTNMYGGCYIGYGYKVKDIAFMQQQ